jgi:hypothetical protein
MRVYFSIDLEAAGGESREHLLAVTQFLESRGHEVLRAPYVLADNPDAYLRDTFGIAPDDFKSQLELHYEWVDSSDLVLADMSQKSEGRAMIIQRALDKPSLGLVRTPILLIQSKQFKRSFGRIVRGLIASQQVNFYEYDDLENLFSWLKKYC